MVGLGRLVLMCGLSFSGKSSIARDLSARLNAQFVSLDDINEARGLHGGMGIPLQEWIETHRIASERVRESLSRGLSVIVDDTSSPRFLRDVWRAQAAETGASFVLLFVEADRDVILQRQRANRSTGQRHDVADDVMRDHLDAFEPPEADEPAIRVLSEVDSPDQIAAQVQTALDRQDKLSRPEE